MEVMGENPASVLFFPSQIPRGVVWDRSRPDVVRCRRFTSKPLARPPKSLWTPTRLYDAWTHNRKMGY